uniref:ZAD domain-containing protein n=1 Tax=Anopheles christyi TaxID=43041 RepID=A0A182K4R2_9DIPT
MANAVPLKMLKICRFCLCQDEAYLIPIGDASELAINIEDVALFSGIPINEYNKTAYAMCLECTNMLKTCSSFRHTCLSNEVYFHELCAVLEASAKEPTEIVELSDSSEDNFDFDEEFGTKSISELTNEPKYAHSEQVLLVTSNLIEEIANDEAFAYSANYIDPGETVYNEDVIHKSFVDWNNSLNPKPPKVEHVREPGKRKLHLCDICGLIVNHIPTHYETHSEVAAFPCPHCPVKTKHRTTIAQHIEQVHRKTVNKICSICGKGFIHHKTYRYHMLTHESKGKKFECNVCSKIFPNAIYLRDHFNRLHNVAKKLRTNDTEDTGRR